MVLTLSPTDDPVHILEWDDGSLTTITDLETHNGMRGSYTGSPTDEGAAPHAIYSIKSWAAVDRELADLGIAFSKNVLVNPAYTDHTFSAENYATVFAHRAIPSGTSIPVPCNPAQIWCEDDIRAKEAIAADVIERRNIARWKREGQ